MKIQKLSGAEAGWFIVVTAVLLFLSYGPILRNFLKTPTDRFYFGQSEYPLDMIGDLTYIQQGYHGSFLASFNYSTMIGGHPSIVKMEYTLIGLLGRVLNISPLFMFEISRFVLSLSVLVIIYFIITRIFPQLPQRIISYAFVLFGTGIILPGVPNYFVGYDAEVFVRLTQAMPHYLAGAGAMLLALYFLSRTLEKPKRTAFFLLSLLFGIISSLLYAPDTVLLISGFPLYIVADSISAYLRTKRVRVDTTKVGILFAYSAVTIAPTAYVSYIVNYVWNDIRNARMEQLFPFHIPLTSYVLAVGVLYLLSFIAVPSVIRKGNALLVLLATWLIMHPVGEYILSPMAHINYFRYFVTPYYVAYGVLGAVGITILADWLRKHLHTISLRLMTLVLAAVVLGTSIGIYTAVWREANICFCYGQFFDFSYPKRTVMEGIFWLQRNTNPDDIVLSEYYTGTLIPAFAGNRVYVSWWYYLVQPPTLWSTDANLKLFYSGRMSDAEALTFLKHGNISYVFYSETEQTNAPGIQTLTYPFLTERYNASGTYIYQVK
jgi:hypothetical protein